MNIIVNLSVQKRGWGRNSLSADADSMVTSRIEFLSTAARTLRINLKNSHYMTLSRSNSLHFHNPVICVSTNMNNTSYVINAKKNHYFHCKGHVRVRCPWNTRTAVSTALLVSVWRFAWFSSGPPSKYGDDGFPPPSPKSIPVLRWSRSYDSIIYGSMSWRCSTKWAITKP